MWQRFTERTRRVIFFAQEEAARLGENYVGVEHLLLGLIREDDSVAARLLERVGVSLASLRYEIEHQVSRGDGRLGQEMQLTPRAKRVIDLAYDQAKKLDNNYIGTEHLLLGLILEGEGIASKLLIKRGVTYEAIFGEVQSLQNQMLTEKSNRKFMLYAQEEAAKRDDPSIKPEHLLIGLLREENAAHRILKALKVSPDDLSNEVQRITGNGDGLIGKKVDLNPATKSVMDAAFKFAQERGASRIYSEDLLYAIANEESCAAGTLLRDRGVLPQLVADTIRSDPYFKRPMKKKFVTLKTQNGPVTVSMDEVKSLSVTGEFGTLEGEFIDFEERTIEPEEKREDESADE